MIRLGLLLSLVPAIAYAAAGLPGLSGATSDVGSKPQLPLYDHVILVMEENHGYTQIVGSGSAPYINNTLIAGGALFTNSFAVSHPSEPNYFALYSGSTQGISDDGTYCFNVPTMGGNAILKNVTFKGYVEDVAQRKHDPWESFVDSSNPTCTGTTLGVNWSTFPSNFATLPRLAWVIPNQTDDMHDGTIAQGDTWLQNNLNNYAVYAKANNSLLIVTWDEDETNPSEGNHIATIFYGAHVKTGSYAESINHYNISRMMMNMFGMAGLVNAATANPIIDCWN